MTPSRARLLRAATAAVFGAVVLAGAWTGFRLVNREPAFRSAEPGTGEVTVLRAIDIAERDALAVRGYVFVGPGGLGLRLCDGMEPGNPPRCRGPFLDLDRVDEGFFALEDGRTEDGAIRWQPEPVTLLGTIIGTRMQVDTILR